MVHLNRTFSRATKGSGKLTVFQTMKAYRISNNFQDKILIQWSYSLLTTMSDLPIWSRSNLENQKKKFSTPSITQIGMRISIVITSKLTRSKACSPMFQVAWFPISKVVSLWATLQASVHHRLELKLWSPGMGEQRLRINLSREWGRDIERSLEHTALRALSSISFLWRSKPVRTLHR